MKYIQKYHILLLVLLMSFPLKAWYPEYSVLVSEYKNTVAFFRPVEFYSIELEAIGKYFSVIYPGQTDLVFQNPAYLGQIKKNLFSLALDRNPEKHKTGHMLDGGIWYNERVASPYHFPMQPHESEEKLNPLAQAVLLKKTRIGMSFGASLEYFYNRNPFYQPSWYWGPMRYADGMGAGMEEGAKDPYGDYGLVSEAENLETEEGLHLAGFGALKVWEGLSIGLKAAMKERNTSGDYRDLDIHTDSPGASDYESYYDLMKKGLSDLKEKEAGFGILFTSPGKAEFGINGGWIGGTAEKSYLESDTSRYYNSYSYGGNYPGTNEYESGNYYLSDKNWKYTGEGIYGSIQGRIIQGSDVELVFSGRIEKTGADLDESESMLRRSSYSSDWYSIYDSTWYRHNSSSRSTLDRPGKGKLSRTKYIVDLGGTWEMSPAVKLTGGISYLNETSTLEATEPFEGSSYAWHWSSNLTEYESESAIDEVKTYKWDGTSTRTILAFPAGIIITMNKFIEFRLGATKIIETLDETEKYDVIVTRRYKSESINGNETITDKKNYVEGYKLPGVHTFTDGVDIHIGGTLSLRENLKLYVALLSSDFEPERARFGLSIHW